MSDTVKLPIVDLKGKSAGDFTATSALFGVEPREDIVHFVAKGERFRYYTKTANTKGRSAVSGGGKKFQKQKGSGRARHGGKRAPIFVGGGVAFGPKPIKKEFKINKKISKLALASVLSDRHNGGQVKVFADGGCKEVKTKSVSQMLAALNWSKAKVGVVVSESDSGELSLSARNIKNVNLLTPELWSTYNFVKVDALIFTEKSIAELSSRYDNKAEA